MCTHIMQERNVNFSNRQRAILPNHEHIFGLQTKDEPHLGYSVVLPKEGQYVEGILYETDEPSLQRLDLCEGCPGNYTRELRPIQKEDGTIVHAHVYIVNRERLNRNLKPTRIYINKLLNGKQFLSEKYIAWLEAQETI